MARTCIYCGQRGVPFSSEEHIVPESLGNRSIVLLPGVVCDGCNSGVLSQLDEALVSFQPLALLRAARGVPGKSGRVKTFRVPGLEIKRGTLNFINPAGAEPGNFEVAATIERDLTQRMDANVAAKLMAALPGGSDGTARASGCARTRR